MEGQRLRKANIMEGNAFFSRKWAKIVTPTCTLTTWSFQRAASHTPHSNTTQQHSTATQHSNTAQQHSTAQPFTRVCLEFLTTLTCRALYGKSHCHGQSCRFLALVFNHIDFQNTARESHCVSTIWTIEKTKSAFFFYIFCISRTPWNNSKLNSRVDDNRKIAKTSEKLAKSLSGPLVKLSN